MPGDSASERSTDAEQHPDRPVALTARDRALLRLLASGHTDTTAAAELGISPRSVSNMLRRLMEQLGVQNRFQLGLALGELRIVLPPDPAALPAPPDDAERDGGTR